MVLLWSDSDTLFFGSLDKYVNVLTLNKTNINNYIYIWPFLEGNILILNEKVYKKVTDTETSFGSM